MGTKLPRGMRAVVTGAGAALLAVGLAACAAGGSGGPATTSAPPPLDLADTSWVLVSRAGGDAGAVDAVPEPSATLRFGPDGTLSGSTGCNRFAGTYVQDGSDLRLDLGPMTLAACTSEDLTAQEAGLLAALPAVRTALASAGRLDLVDADGAVLLTYEPALSDLVGSAWVATGINNGAGAVVSTADTGKVTLEFGADGTAGGSGGCNTYSGPYALEGADGLTIGPVASTERACAPPLMETEAWYYAALTQVTRYEVDGSTLTLRSEDGAAQAVFRSA